MQRKTPPEKQCSYEGFSTKYFLFCENLIWSGENSRVSLKPGVKRWSKLVSWEESQSDAFPEVSCSAHAKQGHAALWELQILGVRAHILLMSHFVQSKYKSCTTTKENITATITGFMLLEAETQEIFLSARCSHCPGNTSKYISLQEIDHRGTEGRAFFFFSFVQQITFLISWVSSSWGKTFSCGYKLSLWVLWTFSSW